METFGQWLLRHRKQRDLTQEEVARAVGYTAGHISALEREIVAKKRGTTVRPDIDLVDKLARLFGRTITEARIAAGYAPPEKDPRRLEALQRDEELEALFHDASTLSDEAREEMRTIWAFVKAEIDRKKAKEQQKKEE